MAKAERRRGFRLMIFESIWGRTRAMIHIRVGCSYSALSEQAHCNVYISQVQVAVLHRNKWRDPSQVCVIPESLATRSGQRVAQTCVGQKAVVTPLPRQRSNMTATANNESDAILTRV